MWETCLVFQLQMGKYKVLTYLQHPKVFPFLKKVFPLDFVADTVDNLLGSTWVPFTVLVCLSLASVCFAANDLFL